MYGVYLSWHQIYIQRSFAWYITVPLSTIISWHSYNPSLTAIDLSVPQYFLIFIILLKKTPVQWLAIKMYVMYLFWDQIYIQRSVACYITVRLSTFISWHAYNPSLTAINLSYPQYSYIHHSTKEDTSGTQQTTLSSVLEKFVWIFTSL